MATKVCRLWFGGSFVAEDIVLELGDKTPAELIEDGRRGCIWYELGEKIRGTTTFEDGDTELTQKYQWERAKHFNGGTFFTVAELRDCGKTTAADNIEGGYPGALGGVRCRNGWYQPFMPGDVIEATHADT